MTDCRHEVLYECCPDPYVDITYNIMLKKRPTNS
jgi:hypothetical protein